PTLLLYHYFAPPPALPPFPTRRSSDLPNQRLCKDEVVFGREDDRGRSDPVRHTRRIHRGLGDVYVADVPQGALMPRAAGGELNLDRKSTRLNSSHGSISYAVFCLKKKK